MTTDTSPKFPDIKVQLTGQDGNAFVIVARVRKAIEDAGHIDEAKEFFEEALSGSYGHLLRTCDEYVTVL